ncbi:UDP-3-O-acyl-N-acetylglucosamine deacetylase [Notoacmeibacter ruber]|uniref:UDP-3-O-acyl-N-acetylglucosamine deacetylase n=1 Tax=Notoacmeibacter ruber TaxID=2670375 RepID=A0A3L7JC13_9HYPH|nr:UDP-3-O-acyl-N-acetylglucosamine deacetylase [Notoacmeibacter ruber]RLQ88176.1 UDP-3-O-acyl-N-acetylglucosamine deacetylase [Notoacmeibacter ruber]
MSDCQTTLRESIQFESAGVHSGRLVRIECHPADADTGIVFHRTLDDGRVVSLPAKSQSVIATSFATVLGAPCGTSIATIEHLMAAAMGCGIDNMIVEIDEGEVPIMDGSARAFVDGFMEAGIRRLSAARRYLRVLKTVRVQSGQAFAEFLPSDGMRFDVSIDFANPVIGAQHATLDMAAGDFRDEIAFARTFGFMKDVEGLWAAGYALGASLENTVVVGDDERVVNPGGLRGADEFVRHKLLDAVGDLALAGMPFIGTFHSYRSGHRINAMALKALLDDKSAWRVESAKTRTGARAGAMAMPVAAAPNLSPQTD